MGDGSSGGFRTSARTPRTHRRRRRRRRLLVLLAVLLAAVGIPLGGYAWADGRLGHAVDLSALPDRPAQGPGTTYLIVGSDSRVGMTAAQRHDLHTGGSADAGRRTDSMILLHTGAHGTSMVSLPRDSWVTIPGYTLPTDGIHHPPAKNKLNAAFALGGPGLLVRTIEAETGVRIDHYTEIGFGGFVGIVDGVGGVPVCLGKAVHDPKSGENLAKGCHTLTGKQALAFVRQRHQEANGDLGRTQNQQKFLAALVKKAASPGVLKDPEKVWATAEAGLASLTVDDATHPADLLTLFRTMKGGGADAVHLNVPIAGHGLHTAKGDAVIWNRAKARRLFAAIRADRRVTAAP
ncbi:hypothetical protein BIV57_22125 [Mangrovactinospora gilvigrisea]|uniref:Cell envelope-related transcriptional attenuator domain-containing protein n=1 Tax=Mangrovactinospora gilvigrisea TaxID=1428644 RepID=A0A1J7B9N4_9ACTN|nr:hypothetical protein BIV57_22125 [Mangrovactinospora gilvigrisea]